MPGGDDANRELLAAFTRRHPFLFHMAEAGSWNRIGEEGLWSTTELLTRAGLDDAAREPIEAARRPGPVVLPNGVVIRDNGVLNHALLARALTDALSPRDWYLVLNAHVFFWPWRKSLENFLNARPYRARAHDVLTIDTASLLGAHFASAFVTPINTGATGRTVPKRGVGTFLPLADWRNAKTHPRWLTPSGVPRGIKEVAIRGGVADIRPHLVEVTREQVGRTPRVLWARREPPYAATGRA